MKKKVDIKGKSVNIEINSSFESFIKTPEEEKKKHVKEILDMIEVKIEEKKRKDKLMFETLVKLWGIAIILIVFFIIFYNLDSFGIIITTIICGIGSFSVGTLIISKIL